MNQHLKNVDLFENYLENSYYFLYYVIEAVMIHSLYLHLEQLVYGK